MKDLTVKQLEALKPGTFTRASQCLYVAVNQAGQKRFVFRWRSKVPNEDGKYPLRDYSIGPYGKGNEQYTLQDARAEAARLRKVVAEMRDPVKEREVDNLAKKVAAATANGIPTFRTVAERYIETRRTGWKNAKHCDQWANTLETYASVIGPLPVDQVREDHVEQILLPIWLQKHETARRVRGRIERVINYAVARKWREPGLNPARLEHVREILPQVPRASKRPKHHKALPYSQLHAFVNELRQVQGTSARALEFLIYTAARTSEVRLMEWSEVDLDAALWTVPADRMKSGRTHRVPLCKRSLALLQAQRDDHDTLVFPGAKEDKPLSNMAMLETVRELRPGYTVHGFRGSFQTWAIERSEASKRVYGAALAHVDKDKVETAYTTGGDTGEESDVLEQRVKLMERWCRYVATAPAKAKVIALKAAS